MRVARNGPAEIGTALDAGAAGVIVPQHRREGTAEPERTEVVRLHACQGTRVVGVLPGAVDTDMTRGLAIPKLAPQEVAAAVVDGLRRGLEEICSGDMAAGVAFGLALDPKEVERQFAQYLPRGAG